MKSKVIIVGAGIGDKDNITVKAKKALENADVIVYDRLINYDIIREFEGKKELYYVGKKASHHTMAQEDINKLMVKMANEGKNLVRLKGGDPYIFARGSEEALFLKENGVDFEVYPGLTAATVCLNSAGIPQTHRNISQSVTYITGHRENDEDQSFEKYGKYDGTLVFYMGLKNLDRIINDLLAGGMERDTDIAIISKGGYNNQKVFKSKINKILSEIRQEDFPSPTIIVIGKTIALSDKLNYFENRLLFNKNILITRSLEESFELSQNLTELGANVVNIPTFSIKYKNLDILEEQIDNFDYDYLIFTSTNSVRIFFKTLLKKHDIRKIGNVKIAAIGLKTKRVIESFNLKVDYYSKEGVAEKLYDRLFSIIKKEDKVYLPHSNLTRPYIIDRLREKSTLRDLEIYDNKIIKEKVNFDEKLDAALFMSSSSVNNFIEVYGKDALKDVKIFSIGAITSQTLKDHGFNDVIQPKIASSENLLEEVEKYYENEKN